MPEEGPRAGWWREDPLQGSTERAKPMFRSASSAQSLLVAITTSRSYAPLKVFWSMGVELYCHTV